MLAKQLIERDTRSGYAGANPTYKKTKMFFADKPFVFKGQPRLDSGNVRWF